jgi:ribose transport system ATP-binding protein
VNKVILETKNINKSFGPTHADKDVTLSFCSGEIRGLVGENGSGKSTLVSIIAGIYGMDSGEMWKDGRPYHPHSPVEAYTEGVNIVVQELGLVDGLTVAENIFLGRCAQFTKHGVLNVKRLYQAAKAQFEKWKIHAIPVQAMAGRLTVEEKKLVELVRALSTDPDVLILDEITAALSQDNRERLYRLMGELRAQGKAILFISHDLKEVIELSDNITVMKDGQVVETLESAEISEDQLKRMMVGREIQDMYYQTERIKRNAAQEVVLAVEGLTVAGAFENVNFTLYRGETLGIGGLSDAGIHPLGKALFGLLDRDGGQVKLVSKDQPINSVKDAIRNGISYVPKDRDREALMVSASIEDNLCLPSIELIKGRLGFINPVKTKNLARKLVKEFEIKTEGIKQNVDQLSGGNRQKVSLGSWLSLQNEVIILDCPTRGVDVGVKANIYKLIAEAKAKGVAIILISDELPELIGTSDRIMIMKEGRVSKLFVKEEGFTEKDMIEVMI